MIEVTERRTHEVNFVAGHTTNMVSLFVVLNDEERKALKEDQAGFIAALQKEGRLILRHSSGEPDTSIDPTTVVKHTRSGALIKITALAFQIS